VPESMYIRYKLTTTLPATAGANNALRGTPVYSPIARLETIVGSQVVESIQNYNQLCNMLVNSKMNYAQKVGLANSFGYSSSATATSYAFDFSTNCPNGLSFATSTAANAIGANVFLAAPLGCILSNADHLVPLKFMPSCRIQLSLDTLGNAYRLDGTNPITAFLLSNVELCYDIIEFSPMVDQAISSMGAGSNMSPAQLAAAQFGGGGSTTINNITVEGTVVDSAGLLAAIQGGVQTINRNGSSLSGVAGILATYL